MAERARCDGFITRKRLSMTELSLVRNGWKRNGACWYLTLSFVNDPTVRLVYNPATDKIIRLHAYKTKSKLLGLDDHNRRAVEV